MRSPVLLAALLLGLACRNAAPPAGSAASRDTAAGVPMPVSSAGAQVAAAQRADAQALPSRRTAIVAAVERASGAVVSINVTSTREAPTRSPWDFFFVPEGARVVQGYGTGFVIRPNGVIVTNQHVVANATKVVVTLPDGTDLPARVLGEDPLTDIAVLRVERQGLPTVVAGHSTDLMIGEWVVAMGNPYAYLLGNAEPTVTVGVVSATSRNILPTGEQTGLYLDMIQTDAAINPGNSGGPLTNVLGEVVGVNSSIFSNSGGSVGLGFAIPIERALRVADEIIKSGAVRRAWVGLDVEGAAAMRNWKSQGGVVVASVTPEGPAARAGLRQGDVLVEANGRRLRNYLDWEAVKLDLHVGDGVELSVRGGGGTVRRRIVTGDLPTVTAEKVTVLQDLQLINVTPQIQAERSIRSERGALIFRISPQVSRATGLREGRRDRRRQPQRRPDGGAGRGPAQRPLRPGHPGVCRARRADHLHRPRVPMTDDRWRSPLGARYASPAMQVLWGEPHRIGLWRRLWLALAEAERELGLDIPEEALAQMRGHLDDADLAAANKYERRFRHDVMAHIHAFGDQAPAARPYLHLGATSAFVTDNADLIVMRDGLRLLLGRIVAVLQSLEGFARRTAGVSCLAYTHFQPAQLTTVGKRATLWMQDFALDVEEVAHRLEALRFRGCQGTTGTQASFLELFGGDHGKVRELERRVTAKLGFREQFAVTGQTYARKTDSMVLDALSGIAQSAAKMAGDLRLLQHEGELLEPFESEQIGSSAMAYKRNPMRAERIAGLARFVISLQANGAHTAASQWLERTLDDSANRRLTLPEAFLGADAILVLATNIAAGIEVREDVIRRHVAEQMPFMATERWLMLGVAAGGDRQSLHEVIRRHSLLVADAVSHGAPNDLLDRLSADPAFGDVPAEALRAELDPAAYTGRAEPQVSEFLGEYLQPLLERARPLAAETGGAEVRV